MKKAVASYYVYRKLFETMNSHDSPSGREADSEQSQDAPTAEPHTKVTRAESKRGRRTRRA